MNENWNEEENRYSSNPTDDGRIESKTTETGGGETHQNPPQGGEERETPPQHRPEQTPPPHHPEGPTPSYGDHGGQNPSYGSYERQTSQDYSGYRNDRPYYERPPYDHRNEDPGYKRDERPKKKGGPWKLLLVLVLVIAVLGTAVGSGVYATLNYIQNHYVKLPEGGNQGGSVLPKVPETTPAPKDMPKETVGQVETPKQEVSMDVSGIVKEVLPSVVAITNTLELTAMNPFTGETVSGKEGASGSGIIIGMNDKELLIATNAHVVNGETDRQGVTSESVSLTVQFFGNESVKAYLKGIDDNSDLAVIGVKASDLKDSIRKKIRIAKIGDSTKMLVGNGVIAIGNALGYGQSMTVGYISAVNRQVTGSDGVVRTMLQTDAAINPGNSGGGLFNMKGELIGINESKLAGRAIEGIGYAIPITNAMKVLDTLKTQKMKKVLPADKRGYLGIIGTSIPAEFVESYGYPKGVIIRNIITGSAAAKSDLRIQDIVTAINGVYISTMDQLKKQLSYYAAGETIELQVSRVVNGNRFESLKIPVTLGSRDSLQNNQ